MAKKNMGGYGWIILILTLLTLAALTFGYLLLVEQRNDFSLWTQPDFVIEDFTGAWYSTHEIPMWFTRDCSCTEARYQLTSDDTLTVRNSCVLPDGSTTVLLGEAVPIFEGDVTRLRVGFDGVIPRSGYFFVLAHSSEGGWAVVGSPDRENLWFLSRDRTLDHAVYVSLLEYSASLGFDVSRVKPVSQDSCE